MSIPLKRSLRVQLFMGGGYKAVRGLISLDITNIVCLKSTKIFLNFKTNCLCNNFFCKCLFIQAKPSLQLTNIYFVFFLSHNALCKQNDFFFKYKKNMSPVNRFTKNQILTSKLEMHKIAKNIFTFYLI